MQVSGHCIMTPYLAFAAENLPSQIRFQSITEKIYYPEPCCIQWCWFFPYSYFPLSPCDNCDVKSELIIASLELLLYVTTRHGFAAARHRPVRIFNSSFSIWLTNFSIASVKPPAIDYEDQNQVTTVPTTSHVSTEDRISHENLSDIGGASSFRVRQFADRKTLSGWFPQIKSDESNNWRIWFSRRSRALMVQIGIIGIILITNLSVTIFAVSSYGSKNGVGLIYQGNCSTVKRLDQWMHLLINLLGTGMLSASNYCMQLQAAPTRENVDSAHEKGKWLDIGIPSLRNLKYLSNWRRASWAFLALTSIPIHLM